MEDLRKAGFTVTPAGGSRVMVSRDSYASVLENVPGAPPRVVEPAGILMAGGIGKLVDGGFQKFFLWVASEKAGSGFRVESRSRLSGGFAGSAGTG